jgi:hypothetical protein
MEKVERLRMLMVEKAFIVKGLIYLLIQKHFGLFTNGKKEWPRQHAERYWAAAAHTILRRAFAEKTGNREKAEAGFAHWVTGNSIPGRRRP